MARQFVLTVGCGRGSTHGGIVSHENNTSTPWRRWRLVNCPDFVTQVTSWLYDRMSEADADPARATCNARGALAM